MTPRCVPFYALCDGYDDCGTDFDESDFLCRGMYVHFRSKYCCISNINLQDELSPKTGVYAVTVECRDKQFKGVANIGYSPTFDDHIFTVEVHILDFDENIYGQNIRVNFISHIRDEIKFANINELSEQIRRDIEKARHLLS